ncbi:unnamed protein product, partial [Staurois parvus]
SAAPFVCRPAFTCSAPVVKTRKKQKFFLTSTILPVSKPVSLPSENLPSMVQPGASAPTIQPDVFTQPDASTQPDELIQPDDPIMPDDPVPDDPVPAVMPGDPMPAVKPDDPMPDDPVPAVMPGDPMPAVEADDPMPDD